MNGKEKIIGDGDMIEIIAAGVLLSFFVGIVGLYLGWW